MNHSRGAYLGASRGASIERLGSLDAVFLAIESPTSPMSIGSVATFEGVAPSLDAVREFVATKLHDIPRCRQRVRESPHGLTRPVWISDADFDIDHHLHEVSLPRGDAFALERLVEDVMARPLDRQRALWEMWVVDDHEGGRWWIIAKVHHCMVDGIAGSDLLTAMLDGEPHPARRAAVVSWKPESPPTTRALLWFGLGSVGRSMWGHARGLVEALLHVRMTWSRVRDLISGAEGLWRQPSRRGSSLTGPIGSTRTWTHTRASLTDLRDIRRAFGGTVNDAVLTAIAHGFRELLLDRGDVVAGRDVMALMPVSTRGADARGSLDNRVAVTHALLPVDIEDPVATHAVLRRHLEDLKSSHQSDASTVLLHTGDLVPHPIASLVARAVVRAQQNLETITTNVPGPQVPLYLCGRQMLEAYPFAPIAGRIRIAIAIWSYRDTLHIGVTSDRESANDTASLTRGIDEALRCLHISAGELQARR